MLDQKISALSIARPLVEALAARPFSGRVLGRFDRACNLVDEHGCLIALVLPEVGNGPFSIVVEEPGLFRSARVDQPVYADEHRLVMGDWQVNLSAGVVWEPRLTCSNQRIKLSPVLAEMLRPYAEWPPLSGVTAVAKSTQRLAGEAAARLQLALVQYKEHGRLKNWEELSRAGGTSPMMKVPFGGQPSAVGGLFLKEIEAAVAQLAGLGGGLTPAGDDYLMGVMAALWLSGDKSWPAQIAAKAAPRTTTLSAAFLQAAGRGEFIEPWHELAQALFAGTPESFGQALKRVAEFGASSGLDALAGFSMTLFDVSLNY